MVVSIITSSFLVYILVDYFETEKRLHLQQISCHLTEAFHMLYNVQSDDKCENEFKDLFQNIDDMFLGKEDLCLDISHNNVIHISSVVTHDLTVDTHTLLPFPYHMLWRKYDAHVL